MLIKIKGDLLVCLGKLNLVFRCRLHIISSFFWVVSSLAVPGSIPLRMSTVAIKIDSVSISKK